MTNTFPLVTRTRRVFISDPNRLLSPPRRPACKQLLACPSLTGFPFFVFPISHLQFVIAPIVRAARTDCPSCQVWVFTHLTQSSSDSKIVCHLVRHNSGPILLPEIILAPKGISDALSRSGQSDRCLSYENNHSMRGLDFEEIHPKNNFLCFRE
jgi:hypothetical protein